MKDKKNEQAESKTTKRKGYRASAWQAMKDKFALGPDSTATKILHEVMTRSGMNETTAFSGSFTKALSAVLRDTMDYEKYQQLSEEDKAEFRTTIAETLVEFAKNQKTTYQEGEHGYREDHMTRKTQEGEGLQYNIDKIDYFHGSGYGDLRVKEVYRSVSFPDSFRNTEILASLIKPALVQANLEDLLVESGQNNTNNL